MQKKLTCQMDDMVLGLSLFPFLKVSRYVDPASRIDITECHSRLRWLQNYDIPCSPLHEREIMNNNKTTQEPKRSFTSVQMVHTHTLAKSWKTVSCHECKVWLPHGRLKASLGHTELKRPSLSVDIWMSGCLKEKPILLNQTWSWNDWMTACRFLG